MRVLYFDAFSGLSGDKTVAALLSLGVDFDYLKNQLSTLNIDDEFKINLSKKNVHGIEADFFNVRLASEESHIHEHEHDDISGNHHEHHCDEHDMNHDSKSHSEGLVHRNIFDIEKLIDGSSITDHAKEISKGIFKIVAEAESRVHGMPVDRIHFHEIGAVDSILDIVSAGILIDKLEVDEIYSSNIPTGYGFVNCQHGKFPVPAPATVEILKGVPIYKTDIEGELTTPTGAAIIKYLAKEFGGHPEMIVEKTGYGAGTKDFDIPNVLRVELGTKAETQKTVDEFDGDVVVQLETNIDDATPENIAYLTQLLFEKNALDVFMIPVVMKKGRLASLLTVICHEKDRIEIEREIFFNSTTFGIRRSYRERTILKREIEKIVVEGIEVGIKLGYMGNKIIQNSIEYEDAKKLASKLKISFKEAVELITVRLRKLS
jgi:pyridinium-3,5-bisthiocarboxylic acid mononucleotide nickel chelatase